MTKQIRHKTSELFGLSDFSELLAPRHPIIGESPEDLAVFRDVLLADLLPMTGYERVKAEGIIEIEWEIRQRRQLQRFTRQEFVTAQIVAANLASEMAHFEAEEEEARQKFLANGGRPHDWDYDIEFDEEAIMEDGLELAQRAGSSDPKVKKMAIEEIADLDIDPLRELSRAHTSRINSAQEHEDKIAELQARVRELRREYDHLQSMRPIDGEVIEP